MSVVGIDFGNADCVIGQAKRGGIDIILNENSNRKNPTLVAVQDKQRFIGESAVSLARMHFKNTVTDVKRLMGRKFKHQEVQDEISRLAFRCTELQNGDVGIVLNYDGKDVTFSCEQVVGMLLNKMQRVAAGANDNVAPAFAVVSCPGYYSDAQRRALLSACTIGGVNCLRILNEHTAIALAYGIYKSARNLFDEEKPQHVMFIDMGHSSYTVSIVAFVQGKLQVKSASYDRFLGGRDFDMALAKDAADAFQEKYKIDPLASPKSRIKLLQACEKSKKNLSPHGVNATFLNIECLAEDRDYSAQITLDKFEELIEPLLKRLDDPINQALKDAGLEKEDLKDIEIIGGGTRVASVKRHLSKFFGLDESAQNYGLSTTLNADECIARGCALQCAILSPVFKVKEFQVSDRIGFPVKITWDDATNVSAPVDSEENDEDVDMESSGDQSTLIFSREDEYPKTKRVTVRRDAPFSIEAAYDESAKEFLPKESELSLGKYSVSGMPQEPSKIRVNMQTDLNGIFSVVSSNMMQEVEEEEKEEDAKEGEEAPKKKRFRKVPLTVEGSIPGLSVQEVNAATEQELQMAQQDRVIEETANKRNELESFVYEMRNTLSERLSSFVKSEDKSNIENKLTETEDWLYTDEGFDSVKRIYQDKLDELKGLTNPIEFRYNESSARGPAASELQTMVEEYVRMANSGDDKYAHWTDEERNTMRQKCEEAKTWLYELMEKQNALDNTTPPVLTSDNIRQKAQEVKAAVTPIVNKPKPAPKVEIPAAPEETPKKEEDKEEEEEGEKMDLD